MKVHVKSYGCSANIAEGEMIKGQFDISEENNADWIIYNICTVKGDAKILREIRKTKKQYPDKKIAITGCIAPSIIEPLKKMDSEILLINTHHIDKIKELITQKKDALTYAKPVKLLLKRKRNNPIIGIIPIASGCLDACAYCSTRLIKGPLYSYPPDKILEEVRNCEGCKEIWITAQDTCCYGFDIGTNLAELLQQVAGIPGDFMIRVGMGNPRHAIKYLPELIKAMKHPKIFKFLHLPLQSGNNEVLKAMKRGHTVETFEKIVKTFRKEIPEISISTDIIVGYPTETEKQFEDTLKAIREIKPDAINTSRFVPRPGTLAATMPQVHGNIRKQRSRILTELYKNIALEQNKKWTGWKGEIIIDEKVKDGMGGRNYAYKLIIIRKDLPLGTKINVEITEAHATYLLAQEGKC